ncbi:cytochrome c oxidase subunit II [Altererythrobacter sp.]|uniref:cytochrome c oxidase subunit II n=1 Tax=Altererythrobacter sp. TaxID=1872480 RepID=UPI003D045DA1
MILGQTLKRAHYLFAVLAIAMLLAIAPRAAMAQDATETPAAEEAAAAAPAGYVPMAPTEGKGMPVSGNWFFQDQYSPKGHDALWMHDVFLLPVITVISLFVLGLLLFVVVRYNRRTNPNPSRTTHNTMIEVVWTLVPVLILAVIAYPSLKLLQSQYESPPEDAVTVKVTGYQWYWGYTYPDNGDFEVISNMLDEADALARGEPPQLGVDNRMVVPAGVPLRIQTTAADVIHSFAVPSLWFKLDAVPGRLNERLLTIEEPGVYYGQCSELCGARHGYMPIAVEALPRDKWEQWVREQGGTVGGAEEAAATEATEATEEAPAEESAEAATA